MSNIYGESPSGHTISAHAPSASSGYAGEWLAAVEAAKFGDADAKALAREIATYLFYTQRQDDRPFSTASIDMTRFIRNGETALAALRAAGFLDGPDTALVLRTRVSASTNLRDLKKPVSSTPPRPGTFRASMRPVKQPK